MHECSSHIQHKGEALGLFVVMHECIIPFSIYRGVLTGCIHTDAIVLQVSVVVSCPQGNVKYIALAVPLIYVIGGIQATLLNPVSDV